MTTSTAKQTVSVVIPIYKEFDNLPELTGRLERVIRDQAEFNWEVVYVNDAISVVPSFQFIGNRLGVDANDWTSVIDLRTNFTF